MSRSVDTVQSKRQIITGTNLKNKLKVQMVNDQKYAPSVIDVAVNYSYFALRVRDIFE